MAGQYKIITGSPDDAVAIAKLFSLAWNNPRPYFDTLQFGSIDAVEVAEGMAPRLASWMQKPGKHMRIIRDETTGEVISVAQWLSPETGATNEDPPKENIENTSKVYPNEEYVDAEEEDWVTNLPEGFNRPLMKEFRRKQNLLEANCVKDKSYYTLQNIATHPGYQCRGLASMQINAFFPKLDEEGIILYLEAEGEKGLRLYKKLGFVECGRVSIEDLSLYGGQGSHNMIGMVRYPKTS